MTIDQKARNAIEAYQAATKAKREAEERAAQEGERYFREYAQRIREGQEKIQASVTTDLSNFLRSDQGKAVTLFLEESHTGILLAEGVDSSYHGNQDQYYILTGKGIGMYSLNLDTPREGSSELHGVVQTEKAIFVREFAGEVARANGSNFFSHGDRHRREPAHFTYPTSVLDYFVTGAHRRMVLSKEGRRGRSEMTVVGHIGITPNSYSDYVQEQYQRLMKSAPKNPNA